MERLWAPWRVQYITAEQEEGCIFCKKPTQDNDRENLILKKDDLSFIILNAFPYNNGHLLIAPYRHVADISDLTNDEILNVMHLVSLGKKVLSMAFAPDGFNIGINLGRTAGAGIEDHVHIHIVPRWNGDTNFMPVLADTKVMPQALDDTYIQLLEALRRCETGGNTDDK